MFRIHLARFLALAASTFLVGCTSSGGSLCSSCGNSSPGLFSRLRSPSSTTTVISSGDCCNGVIAGPYLPPPPPGQMQPAPQPNAMPSINENGGQQTPWNPAKVNGTTGVKTSN